MTSSPSGAVPGAGPRRSRREHPLAARSSRVLVGGGDVFVLAPGQRVLDDPQTTYGADDGYPPIAAGTYSLRWEGETARLRLWSAYPQGAPIIDQPDPLTCPGP